MRRHRRKGDRGWLSRFFAKSAPSDFPDLKAVPQEMQFPCPQCGEKAQLKDTYCKRCGMLLGVPVFLEQCKGPFKLSFPYYALLLLSLVLLAAVYWIDSPELGGPEFGSEQPNAVLFPPPAVSLPTLDARQLENVNFKPYISELQRSIQAHWQPPEESRNKSAVVRLRVSREGRLLHCGIHVSSGSRKVDAAALSAVKASGPFPPLPIGYSNAHLDVHIMFEKAFSSP